MAAESSERGVLASLAAPPGPPAVAPTQPHPAGPPLPGPGPRATKTVAIVSSGCRVNKSDADALLAALPPTLRLASPDESPDFVVVDTCTVTNDADQTARQAIRRLAREHPRAAIVATGCYAEVDPGALASLPGVAAVLGGRRKDALPLLLEQLGAGAPAADALPRALATAPCFTPPVESLAGHTRAFLKVQDGCDARCSFCLIPKARGPARSLPFEEALRRIAHAGAHHAEVVLAGVHLGQFGRLGKAGPRGQRLEDLVRTACQRGLAHRLRLSSVEPLEFPLGAIGEPRLCDHFHVPLQSGSPRILAAMRRRYRAAKYRELLLAMASARPGACLGADVMVGFPGETDEDHAATMRLVESLPLAYLHVFTFSPRRGTDAALLPGRVHGRIARARAAELLAFSERRWREHLGRQLNEVAEVVVERVQDGQCRGTARRYFTVRWPATTEVRGELARVRITGVSGAECLGEAVRRSRLAQVP